MYRPLLISQVFLPLENQIQTLLENCVGFVQWFYTISSNAVAIQPCGHQWYFEKLPVPEQDQLPNLVFRALSCDPQGWVTQGHIRTSCRNQPKGLEKTPQKVRL